MTSSEDILLCNSVSGNSAELKMAAPAKRRVMVTKNEERDETSSDSDMSDGNEDDNETMEDDSILNQEIQVEFEARTPEGGDVDGIKRLLQQLFLKAHVDLSSLAELILQQSHVGSVIKQGEVPEEDMEDDDDEDVVFGVTTVFNMTDKKDVGCIKQIRSLLIEKCQAFGTDQTVKILRDLLDRDKDCPHHIGFILSERFVNIPAQISAPLYENLCKEMQAANEKGHKFAFDHYIIVCKAYKAECKRGKNGTTTTDVLSNPEEDIFNQDALTAFDYSVAGEADSGLDGNWDSDGEGMMPFRRVLVISASKLESIVSKIRDVYVTGT